MEHCALSQLTVQEKVLLMCTEYERYSVHRCTGYSRLQPLDG